MQENENDAGEYDPNRFMDWLMRDVFRLKNDAALSRKLEVAPPVISKIRHGRLRVGLSFFVRVHELTDMHIRDIRKRLYCASKKRAA